MGWTPDNLNYVMHEWFKILGFHDDDKENKLACWLGPAEDYGGRMQPFCYRNPDIQLCKARSGH
jgi:hypothetical protein